MVSLSFSLSVVMFLRSNGGLVAWRVVGNATPDSMLSLLFRFLAPFLSTKSCWLVTTRGQRPEMGDEGK